MRLAPLIGVSTSEMRIAERNQPLAESDPNRRELALGLGYPEAVQRAGGVPVVLPPGTPDQVDAILARMTGLCLSGGPDLDPGCYGGPEHPLLGPREPALDAFELALVHGAWARAMPVLAICRGAQVLNVARGGTLVQHLPERTDGSLEHRQAHPSETPAHPVELSAGSLLAAVVGSTRIEVNSFHHQAVDRLGDDLHVVARSPDGIVEAIEGTGPGWAIGVQWHAEGMTSSAEQRRLFDAFAEAAAAYEHGAITERRRAA